MRIKKRDYKTIQLGFRTKGEYYRFHNEAVRSYGETRTADCTYLREIIRQNRKRRNQATREKAKALVETTQQLNDLLLATEDPYVQDEISRILREQVKIWEF